MNDPHKPDRFYNRDEVRSIDISTERTATLREAFERTVAAEYIHDCVAASFEIDGEISPSGAVVSSELSQERVFPLVASCSRGTPDHEDEIFANATVTDPSSGLKLAAHVSQNNVLLSRKDSRVSFESFRDYVLFLEARLNVTLSPTIE